MDRQGDGEFLVEGQWTDKDQHEVRAIQTGDEAPIWGLCGEEEDGQSGDDHRRKTVILSGRGRQDCAEWGDAERHCLQHIQTGQHPDWGCGGTKNDK